MRAWHLAYMKLFLPSQLFITLSCWFLYSNQQTLPLSRLLHLIKFPDAWSSSPAYYLTPKLISTCVPAATHVASRAIVKIPWWPWCSGQQPSLYWAMKRSKLKRIYPSGNYCWSIITGGGTRNINIRLMVPLHRIVNAEVLDSSWLRSHSKPHISRMGCQDCGQLN